MYVPSNFAVPTSDKQLPGSFHADTKIVQYSPDRQFARGCTMTWRWGKDAADKYFAPTKTAIRMRLKLEVKASGTNPDPEWRPPKVSDGLAFAMNPASLVFDQQMMRLGNRTISSTSDRLAEIDMLRHRMYRSGAWLDGIQSYNDSFSNFNDRVNAVSSDGDGRLLRSQQFVPSDLINGSGLKNDENNGEWTVEDPDTAKGSKGVLRVGDLLVHREESQYILRVLAIDWETNKEGEAISKITTALVSGAKLPVDTVTPLFKFLVQRDTTDYDINKNVIDVCWKPPSSMFHSSGPNLPMIGEYRLDLHVNPKYDQQIVETYKSKSLVAGTDYRVTVESVYLYLVETRAEEFKNKTFYLDMEEIQCNGHKLNQQLLEAYDTIHPKSHGVTIAFADDRAGENTNASITTFKAYGDSTASGADIEGDLLKDPQNIGERLTKFQISYADQLYPLVSEEVEFSEDTNAFVHEYMKTKLYEGRLFMTGGQETMQQWLERGYYIHWHVDKVADNESTRIGVKLNFAVTPKSTSNLLLFYHYRRIIKVSVSNIGFGEVVTQEFR